MATKQTAPTTAPTTTTTTAQAAAAAAPAQGAAPVTIAYGAAGAATGKPSTLGLAVAMQGTVTMPGGVVLPYAVPQAWATQAHTLHARAAGVLWCGSPNGGGWAPMHVCGSAQGAVVLRLLPGGKVALHPYPLASAAITVASMPAQQAAK